jgi:threonine/homoserine/homoserine lactone efflux protein
MTLSTWLLYVAAVFVLTVTPGPSVLMSMATAVQFGTRSALLAALGSTTAIAGLMTLSMLGLGSILAASETLFLALKIAGALYLTYLGVSALLSKESSIGLAPSSITEPNQRSHFRRGVLVGMSNPKALLFFGALFPQFLNASTPQLPQFLVLGFTFVVFEMGWLSVYIFTAARARTWLAAPRRGLLFNRLTGVVFLIAAGWLATSKRTST